MFYNLCQKLAKSNIFFYSLLWLMIILTAGTIAECYQGLYYAQKTYFSVYYFYLFNFIPVPGAYTILTIIFLNLLCKLICDKWTIKKLGTLVTHISALLLLLGGFITAHFSHEGYLDLAENKNINYISDYNKLELSVKNNNSDTIFPHNAIRENNTLTSQKLGLKIQIVNYCQHCKLQQNLKNNTKQLVPLPKAKDSEQQNSIVTINIYDLKNNKKVNQDLIYLNNDHNKPYIINFNNLVYKTEFRHARQYLPFSIELNKFEQQLYPGTNITKSYESEVSIKNEKDQLNWHGTISMNNPLRYKGYTFYQSSYYIEDNQYISVLAGVYNIGQSFPYIASIILCVGILLHLLNRVPQLLRNNN